MTDLRFIEGHEYTASDGTTIAYGIYQPVRVYVTPDGAFSVPLDYARRYGLT